MLFFVAHRNATFSVRSHICSFAPASASSAGKKSGDCTCTDYAACAPLLGQGIFYPVRPLKPNLIMTGLRGFKPGRPLSKHLECFISDLIGAGLGARVSSLTGYWAASCARLCSSASRPDDQRPPVFRLKTTRPTAGIHVSIRNLL